MTDTDSLKGQIFEWLAQRGYPLEMRAARELYRSQASVEVSMPYVDPIEGTVRETDIVANWTIGKRNGGDIVTHYANLRLAIECKATTAPWIFFAHDPEGGLAYDASLVAADVPHNLNYTDRQEDIEIAVCAQAVMEDMSLFTNFTDLAYTVVEKSSDHKRQNGGQPRAFDAVRQAASAAHGVLAGEFIPTLVIPVVLTTSPLFKCHLDTRGEIILEATDYASILVHTSSELSALTFVVNANQIHSLIVFCEEAVAAFERDLSVFSKHLSGLNATPKFKATPKVPEHPLIYPRRWAADRHKLIIESFEKGILPKELDEKLEAVKERVAAFTKTLDEETAPSLPSSKSD
ncbi:hypothetical protein [Microbispora sp. NPDC049633]|uniref:hypothetical protein n=1 Tax=Microbispora sp. NPDC049633 TaxID=3154355 RepID=UPI00343879C7